MTKGVYVSASLTPSVYVQLSRADKRTIAVRAQTVRVAASLGGINLQAGVFIRVKGAEIQPAPPSWSGPIKPDQILDVMGLIVLGNGYSLAVVCGS